MYYLFLALPTIANVADWLSDGTSPTSQIWSLAFYCVILCLSLIFPSLSLQLQLKSDKNNNDSKEVVLSVWVFVQPKLYLFTDSLSDDVTTGTYKVVTTGAYKVLTSSSFLPSTVGEVLFPPIKTFIHLTPIICVVGQRQSPDKKLFCSSGREIDHLSAAGVLSARLEALIATQRQPEERPCLLLTTISYHSSLLSHQACQEIKWSVANTGKKDAVFFMAHMTLADSLVLPWWFHVCALRVITVYFDARIWLNNIRTAVAFHVMKNGIQISMIWCTL